MYCNPVGGRGPNSSKSATVPLLACSHLRCVTKPTGQLALIVPPSNPWPMTGFPLSEMVAIGSGVGTVVGVDVAVGTGSPVGTGVGVEGSGAATTGIGAY